MSLPLPLREGEGGGGVAASPAPSPYPLQQGEGESLTLAPALALAPALTDAELRGLLLDCAVLWGVEARITAGADGIEIAAKPGTFLVQRAPTDMRPVRWLLQSPERAAANRPPRALPSIVALLSALRNTLGADSTNRLRIGASS